MEYELKKLTLDDAEDLKKTANNSNVARYLRNVFPYPYLLEDAVDFINFATDNEDELIYGIIIDGKAAVASARDSVRMFLKNRAL